MNKLISVTPETYKTLTELKIVPKESYNAVIVKLIKLGQGDKNGNRTTDSN